MAPLVSGCTFLALDSFDSPHCTTSMQCEVLNTQAGIAASALTRYQCARQDRVCRLLPLDRDGDGDPPREAGGTDCDDANPRRMGNEALARALCGGATTDCCDGVDNNCNDVIDEGQWRASAPQAIGPALEGVTEVNVAPRANATPAVTYAAGGRGMYGVQQGAALNTVSLRYERLFRQNMMVSSALDQCPIYDDAGRIAQTSCTFDDVVAAQSDAAVGQWFVASINRNRCTAGQLRLGHFSESNGRVELADADANTVALGVDVTAAQACTGASRTPSLLGASWPAIASIPGAAPRALAAWLARPFPGTQCGTSANVEAVGVWRVDLRDSTAMSFAAVRATDDGHPHVLGVTQGSGRPAVLSAPGAGVFVVGYGLGTGGVALHALPAFDVSTARLDTSRAPLEVRGDSMGPGDAVSLAAGGESAGMLDVGVTWRAGCDGAGGVWFARVRLSGGMLTMVSAPLRVAATSAGAPSVAYADAGFAQPGSTRGGAAVTAANDGGWVVTWPDGAASAQRVLGRRVSELDGQLVAEDPLVVAEMLSGTVSHAVAADAATSSGRLAYFVYATGTGALSGGDLLCKPTSP